VHLDLAAPGQLTIAVLPELILAIGAMILLLVGVWGEETAERTRRVGIASIGVTLAALVVVGWMWSSGITSTLGLVAVDGFRWGTSCVVLVGALLTLLLSLDDNERIGVRAPESYVLTLLATSGMLILLGARDLIMVFIGMEFMSIAVYILAGIERRSARSAEAALKYFLLGAFSSAFLLYGIALIYGAAASTNLAVIGDRLADPAVAGSSLFIVGVALMLVGFGFKVAAVPFHMWTPDVYEGAPTPYTAFMASALKAAAFAAFVRVTLEALPNAYELWHGALWWIAVLTMVIGNIIALAQNNLKRLLAYSSIAHAGYLLVALLTGTDAGAAALVFYLFAYTFATVGAFGIVCMLGHSVTNSDDLDAYAGLWSVRPGSAAAMAVFMLALLGFPLAGGMGFFAKWYVLQAALQAPSPQTRLAIILVLTSVLSAAYYLRVIIVMFFRPRPDGAPAIVPAPTPTRFVIGATVALILVLGVYPSPAVRLARASAPLGDRTVAPQLRSPEVPVAGDRATLPGAPEVSLAQ
jgi:NADH-quinone oxidoreductase subunit N